MSTFQSEGYAQVIGGRIWYGISGDIENKGVPLVVVHGGPGMSHDYLLTLAKLAKEMQHSPKHLYLEVKQNVEKPSPSFGV